MSLLLLKEDACSLLKRAVPGTREPKMRQASLPWGSSQLLGENTNSINETEWIVLFIHDYSSHLFSNNTPCAI